MVDTQTPSLPRRRRAHRLSRKTATEPTTQNSTLESTSSSFSSEHQTNSKKKRHIQRHPNSGESLTSAELMSADAYIPDVNAPKHAKPAPKKQRSMFVCDTEMHITVPDVPCDGKFLRVPRARDSLYAYCSSSLDAREKFEIFPERNMGIPIEAIDPHAYDTPIGCEIHADDMSIQQMCSDVMRRSRISGAAANTRRRKSLSSEQCNASWFFRPEMMSSNFNSHARIGGGGAELAEAARAALNEEKYDSVSIVDEVEESFELNRYPTKHSSNPNLTLVQALPIYPHHDKSTYSYVMFDHDTPIKTSANESVSVLMRSKVNTRETHLYVPSTKDDTQTRLRFVNHYHELLSKTIPEAKDKHFLLWTKNVILHGELSSRSSLKRATNVDKLSREQRQKIPESITFK